MMQSFFTCGPDEVRQWSIRVGSTAPEAAGVIHTDFQKHFICAETYAFKDWNKAGATYDAVAQVRSQGKIRTEGKKYVMNDGDIVVFKHNAGK
jgi:ribosome-binding ATPase YchF (GTP1/OBG family)